MFKIINTAFSGILARMSEIISGFDKVFVTYTVFRLISGHFKKRTLLKAEDFIPLYQTEAITYRSFFRTG